MGGGDSESLQPYNFKNTNSQCTDSAAEQQDKEISIKNKYLEKLKEQRKSLQQLLLIGIVRV